MSSNPRSLLIITCSQRKRLGDDLLPAIERYDGPPFRLLRRFLREHSSISLNIYILSAEFGLIPSNRPIPAYDRRMTSARAQELKPLTIAGIKDIFSTQSYQELCICMGQDYHQAINGYEAVIPFETAIKIIVGSPGKKLTELHSWLYRNKVTQLPKLVAKPAHGRARLRGIEVAMTPTQIYEVARRALIERRGNPNNYYSCYIQIDGEHIAPKWLVSQLTGLSASSFHTDEAVRLLQQLGIQINMA